mmetsp:Transcript_26979/g.30324  ORF Transcript_26979/g.30324 Transcript_26979/m.30324 type:complete len:108 (-) Transcript_26979:94-417(-)
MSSSSSSSSSSGDTTRMRCKTFASDTVNSLFRVFRCRARVTTQLAMRQLALPPGLIPNRCAFRILPSERQFSHRLPVLQPLLHRDTQRSHHPRRRLLLHQCCRYRRR